MNCYEIKPPPLSKASLKGYLNLLYPGLFIKMATVTEDRVFERFFLPIVKYGLRK